MESHCPVKVKEFGAMKTSLGKIAMIRNSHRAGPVGWRGYRELREQCLEKRETGPLQPLDFWWVASSRKLCSQHWIPGRVRLTDAP